MKNTAIENLQKLQAANRNLVNIPKEKRKSFRLDIRRFYTDVNGQILDKSTVPDALKVKIPVYIFGNFDKDGNYFIGQKNFPIDNNVLTYYYTETYKGYFDQLSFSGFNNLQDQLRTGDILQVYTDDIKAPTYFVWIVISGEQRAYSSILAHPANQSVFNTKYFSDSELQYLENLFYVKIDEVGNYKIDSINPFVFKNRYYGADGFIDIHNKFSITNFFGIYFYYKFDTDLISLIFNYEK